MPARPTGTAWLTGIREEDRHHTLVRFAGELDDAALADIRALCPGRHVSRCGSEIVVWPLGTTWVSHGPRSTVLRGSFDERDVQAVLAAHPGRLVSRDGDLITVWPAIPAGADTQTSQGGTR
ncbi:hypothetical protein [Streptomyces poriferorum]|uniref:Uncharacterized protein n=1 Tax=Streptomyces poriferorum TaxID=2798799 RepID=A0ABY9J7T1_9ACTN|nr:MULTISPECIES: hypothetical protein [unclassified Streptomyces]MDP5317335.1 hypothetical protein [Streptomyces sp. Alt4]WLQ62026.1 hypothetical protein P8A19_41875 [Streptomyces sp. Alt2]